MHLGLKIFGVDLTVLLAQRHHFVSKICFWRDGISKSAYLDMNVKLSLIF